MTAPRPVIAAGLAVCSLALVACQKPAPSVSVFSGTKSTHTEAVCWQWEDGESLKGKDCLSEVKERARGGAELKSLPIKAGVLGISVDPEVAEGGWTASIDGQPLMQNPVTGTYFNLDLPPGLPPKPDGYLLQITANADGAGARGVWWLKLEPKV